jgi:pyridoxine kinase
MEPRRGLYYIGSYRRGLARGLPVWDAIVLAKKFITESLKVGFALNKWVGPGNPSNWRKDHLFGIEAG